MKRCPACSQTYDDAEKFCSRDAQALVAAATGLNDTGYQASAVQQFSMSERSRPEDQYLGKIFNNKFRIDAVLGRGGMGAVYRATDTVLDRIVAVKLLRPDLVGDENLDNRFLREARAAARIEHPHAITVHDFGTLPEGGAFIVMELIQGVSLRDLLKRGGALAPERAVEFIKQAASAVAAAHQVGVIHRDLKPENIMLKDVLGGQSSVKVVDFGLAKLKESVSQSLANLTTKGEIIGTPYYMSPEQCAGGEIDERTDIYSLGIILYEMLAGRPPFQGTPAAVIGMHLYKAVPRLTDLNGKIPTELEELVLNMLQKERDKRPAKLGEVIKRLEALYRPVAQPSISSMASVMQTMKAPDDDDLSASASVISAAIETSSPLPAPPPAQPPPPPAAAVPRHKADTLKLEKEGARNAAEQENLRPKPSEKPTVSQITPHQRAQQTALVSPPSDSEAAPTSVFKEENQTGNQRGQTALYNSHDFRTKPEAAVSLPVTPVKTTSPLGSDLPVLGEERKVETTAQFGSPRLSYRRFVLIGTAGLLIGLLLSLLILSAPGPAGSATPNAKPATPAINTTPSQPTAPATQETSPPNATPRSQPQSRPKNEREKGRRADRRENQERDDKSLVGDIKDGFGWFGRKVTGKKEKKNKDN